MQIHLIHDQEFLHGVFDISSERAREIISFSAFLMTSEKDNSYLIFDMVDFCKTDNERLYGIWVLSNMNITNKILNIIQP